MSQLWSRLRAAQLHHVGPAPPPATEPCAKALFVLDAGSVPLESDKRFDLLFLCDRAATILNWEVRGTSTLQTLPQALSRQVDEYEIILVVVPSAEVAQKHASYLRSLSPEYPFLIVINDVNTVKTQCATMSISGGGSAIPILLRILCDGTAEAPTFAIGSCTARRIVEVSGGALSLTQVDAAVVDVAWCTPGTALSTETHGTVTVAVDTDEEVDGRYVGGLLKHAIPNARIRLSEKRGLVSLRLNSDGPSSADTLSSIEAAMGVPVSRCGTAVLSSLVSTDQVFALCAKVRAAKLTHVHSVLPAFQLEVHAGFSVLLALEMLRRAGTVDDEISLRIEKVGLTSDDRHNTEGQATGAVPKTVAGGATYVTGRYSAAAVSSPPISLPAASAVNSSAQPTSVTAPPARKPAAFANVMPDTLAADSSSRVPLPPRTTEHLESAPLLTETVKQELRDYVATLAVQREEMFRSEIATLKAEVVSLRSAVADSTQRELAVREELHVLQREMHNSLSASAAGQERLGVALQSLGTQLEQVKENAADHRLVESALNEIKASSASLEGVRASEERVGAIARLVQQQADATRTSVEGMKGHLEALTVQHQQLVNRVEGQREAPNVQRLLETTVQQMDARMHDLDHAIQKAQSENNVYRHSFELAVNRLYEQMKYFHEDLSRMDVFLKSQVQRVDDIQRDQGAWEAGIRRSVEASTAASTQARAQAIEDQLLSVKSYCVAAIERSGELQSEKVDAIEKKLANDMQRAIEILKKQQGSEVQRIQAAVEQHVAAQRKLMDELQMMSPSKLDGSPRKEETQLLREQIERTFREQETLRERFRQLELLQSEVSGFLGDEDKRLRDTQDLVRRVEDLEASVVFIESRI